jgi:hypothetical protein
MSVSGALDRGTRLRQAVCPRGVVRGYVKRRAPVAWYAAGEWPGAGCAVPHLAATQNTVPVGWPRTGVATVVADSILDEGGIRTLAAAADLLEIEP